MKLSIGAGLIALLLSPPRRAPTFYVTAAGPGGAADYEQRLRTPAKHRARSL